MLLTSRPSVGRPGRGSGAKEQVPQGRPVKRGRRGGAPPPSWNFSRFVSIVGVLTDGNILGGRSARTRSDSERSGGAALLAGPMGTSGLPRAPPDNNPVLTRHRLGWVRPWGGAAAEGAHGEGYGVAASVKFPL